MSNNYYQSLMARDALGRVISDAKNIPLPRENRQVGLFYFLWLGEEGRHKPYNISEITDADQLAGYKPDSDVWGSVGVYHHWGEPLYGYYYSDDEWVVRRHMKLIMQADIDFLFFDTTNSIIYEKNAKLVMRVLQEYCNEGKKIPKVMFYTNTDSGKCVQEIYERIYKPGYYRDTWYYYDGKPLIIANIEECSRETVEFFTIKRSQWPNEPEKADGWPWMDFVRPQRVFKDKNDNCATINVSVAQHPQCRFGDSVMYGENSNRGRSYHNGAQDTSKDAYLYGYNFSEQFDRAIETDPPVVLVTGWNEWIAGRWQGIPERPIMFVDCANYEYSRDIEMMRGGYFDNYFMQLVDYVHKYKGMERAEPCRTMSYCGFTDGDLSRNNEGFGTVYKNCTQRNTITDIDVSDEGENLIFAIKTKAPVTEYDGTGTWMKIYLNLTGGINYDYILNNSPDKNNRTTLAKVTDGFECRDIADAEYRIDGNIINITVKKSDINYNGELWFKVADSTEAIKNFEDFYILGDAAPLGRLNYVFKS